MHVCTCARVHDTISTKGLTKRYVEAEHLMEKRQFIPNTLRVADAIACATTSVGRVLAGICYFAFVHCGLRGTGTYRSVGTLNH